MSTSRITPVVHHLRRAMLYRDGAGLTDWQLLEIFIERREEAAFSALLYRHGPMVWKVCRRILRDYHDAQDAFQATFLVLVRKAATVLPSRDGGATDAAQSAIHGPNRRAAGKSR